MKILQIAERTYPAKGGVELHTAKISELLAKRGHHVTLVVFNSLDPRDCGYGITYQKPYLIIRPKKNVLPQEEYLNGFRILRFESKMQLFSYYWSPAMLSWLFENAGEFDIMHTHTLRFSNNEFTALAHAKCKTPFVLSGHDKLKLDYMGTMPFILDSIYRLTIGRLLLNMAERVIAFDRDYAEEYRKFYGVSNEKIRIIPNGIDYTSYNQLPNGDELKENLGNPENVILYIGRFIDYKNPDLLISSFKLILKRFPKSCLLMIGKDYGLLPYCKKLAIDLGLKGKVVFIEDAGEEIKLKALSIADLCVIPSDYESFGIVALEAQAAGVPVVASYVGGLKHVIIEGETGLFLKELTLCEIVKKISLLLCNDNLRSRLCLNGRKFAKNFSWDIVTDRLLDCYKEILHQ